jgi:hypothetical protein
MQGSRFSDGQERDFGLLQVQRETYPDEAARDLELDFDLVMKATGELRQEGRLVEA